MNNLDRIVSDDEKIRKAEEISNRRRNRIPISNINSKTKKMSRLTRTFVQVLSSIIIFGIVYLVNQNNSMAFENIKPIMSNDINFQELYTNVNGFVKNISTNIKDNSSNQFSINFFGITKENTENKDAENKLLENNQTENSNTNNSNINDNSDQIVNSNINNSNINNSNINDNSNQTNNSNINSNSNQVDNSNNNDDSDNSKDNIESKNESNSNNGIGGGNDGAELSQTDQDIAFIKSNANFIKPVDGWVSSGYGERTPTDIVSATHAGVDLAANAGTDIIASMEGTVELVSSEGDYGNHLKITNGEITTLYAHCSKIIVNQGDYITQGQKIAEVGSTGRSTGPHLHFEIRRDNRTVDPQAILEF